MCSTENNSIIASRKHNDAHSLAVWSTCEYIILREFERQNSFFRVRQAFFQHFSKISSYLGANIADFQGQKVAQKLKLPPQIAPKVRKANSTRKIGLRNKFAHGLDMFSWYFDTNFIDFSPKINKSFEISSIFTKNQGFWRKLSTKNAILNWIFNIFR